MSQAVLYFNDFALIGNAMCFLGIKNFRAKPALPNSELAVKNKFPLADRCVPRPSIGLKAIATSRVSGRI